MPTNEQRKALSKRLRTLASHAPADADMVLDALDLYQGEYIEGFDPRCVERLADLIEPEPERTCEVEHWGGGVFYLSCGHDSRDWPKPNYCPDCGAKVVD